MTLLETQSRRNRLSGSFLLNMLVLMVVLGQRFAIPAGTQGQVAVSVLGVLLLVAVGLRDGSLCIDRTVAVLLGVALISLAIVSIAQYLMGLEGSALSVVLLLLIYLPAVAVARESQAAERALRLFVDLMLGLALLSLVTFGLQYAGVGYRDYLATVVPGPFLQQGYNTSYPIAYGSEIFRNNGLVFLEPSFFSVFLAISVLASLHLGHRRRLVVILLATLVSTASGNGVVVLVCGAVMMGLSRRGRMNLFALVVPVVVSSALLLLTPLGAVFVSRLTEGNTQDSSVNLRAVEPYRVLIPATLTSTRSAAIGSGPGSAQDYFEANVLDSDGFPSILAPPVTKLFFEYGVIGLITTVCFLAWLFTCRGIRVPWWPGLIVVYFLLNASLQQPTIAATCYVFLSVLVPKSEAGATGVSQHQRSLASTPITFTTGLGRSS